MNRMEEYEALLQETEEFMRGELDNVTVANSRIMLDVVQGGYVPYGCYTSPAIPLAPFDALRPSWNAFTPPGTAVEAQAQSITVTGTVTRTARRGGTVTLDVRLSDGSAVTYEVDSAAPATRDGRSIDAEELNADDWVELVVHNGVVESITAYEDAGRNTRLEGTVLETDTRDETLRVRLSDGGTLTVDVSGASFLTADGGSTSLRRLSEDDRVQLFGDYSGNRFVATLVILL